MSTLMVSVSGIRGIVGDGLDPHMIVKYASAYAGFIGRGKIVLGRDARITGEMVDNLVTGTLLAKGLDIINIGICPTPTIQYNVRELKAAGGIAISASHNPNEWNALKLLNSTGQFLNPDENEFMIEELEESNKNYTSWTRIGKSVVFNEGIKNHMDAVLNLKYIDREAIKRKNFKVLADCVNGAGAYVIPQLLREFGCEVIEMNCEKTGIFPRMPEPVPENLKDTMQAVKDADADLGIVVDPDVDRLVLITNEGEPFSEENTITQAVRFILTKVKGNVVVNLSTTRAVDDVTEAVGCKVFRSPVGEANVVKKMKAVEAVIGGEGSGGVIFPSLHYGRDALVGIAITLQHLLEFGKSISELKKALPQYSIYKRKINIAESNPDLIIETFKEKYKDKRINTDDGLRIDFDDHWLHLRKSNTEPIIRIITEAKTQAEAESKANKYLEEILPFIK
ncbi:phosphoglucosamine mutase [bacterium BMS3Abin03]|nr:phosphoglucosamine mutase [bacterium BMS3Abin03]MCG6960701.1 phosphoglucosamine mutase [bacterium BMS3Abin03]